MRCKDTKKIKNEELRMKIFFIARKIKNTHHLSTRLIINRLEVEGDG